MIDDGVKLPWAFRAARVRLPFICSRALRSFYPKHFEVIAITLDYRFGGMDGDYSEIQKLCDSLDVKYVVKKTDLWDVIFNIRKEKNPCSLCAKMRRGILHDTAKEYGCNKIALGHHLDDAAETFMMNLLNGGTIKCFSPVSFLSRKELYLIRPLIFAYEKDVKRAAASLDLPIVKSKCPADWVTERQRQKSCSRLSKGNTRHSEKKSWVHCKEAE